MNTLITVSKKDKALALIIKDAHEGTGVEFLTPDAYSQQVAYMHHPKGKVIDAHVHNLVHRNVVMTQEVLFIKKGKLRVDFYDDYKDYLESYILESGDTIILISGGHGFEVLEEVEMIEVKQGPYSKEDDKVRFESVSAENIKMIEEN